MLRIRYFLAITHALPQQDDGSWSGGQISQAATPADSLEAQKNDSDSTT